MITINYINLFLINVLVTEYFVYCNYNVTQYFVYQQVTTELIFILYCARIRKINKRKKSKTFLDLKNVLDYYYLNK